MPAKGISHRAVIELLGNTGSVARALGLRRPNTAAHWKRRGIPSVYWPAIERLAQARGLPVSVADLARGSPTARARRKRMHRPGTPDLADAA